MSSTEPVRPRTNGLNVTERASGQDPALAGDPAVHRVWAGGWPQPGALSVVLRNVRADLPSQEVKEEHLAQKSAMPPSEATSTSRGCDEVVPHSYEDMSSHDTDLAPVMPPNGAEYRALQEEYGPPLLADAPTRAEADTTVRSLCVAVTEGRADAGLAGWVLLEWATCLRLAEETVGQEYKGGRSDVRDDLEEKARHVVEMKLTQSSGVEVGFFQFKKAATASFCGWVYHLVRRVVELETARATSSRVRTVNVDPTDPVAINCVFDNDSSEEVASTSGLVVDPETQSRSEALIWVLNSVQANTRGHRRTLLGLQVFSALTGVPPLGRPLERADRDRLRRAVRRNPAVLHGSLIDHVGSVDERFEVEPDMRPSVEAFHDADPKVVDLLKGLWAPLDVKAAHRMLDAEFEHQTVPYVMAALAQRPRPTGAEIVKIRALVRGQVRGVAPRRLAGQLADAWMACEFQAVSDYNGRSDDAVRDARAGAAKALVKEYPALARSAAELPGAPLGDTPAKVTQSLFDLVTGAGLMDACYLSYGDEVLKAVREADARVSTVGKARR